MDRELINKKIDNYFEIRRSLWTVLIVLNGGIAGLFLSIGNFSLNLSIYIKLALLFIGGLLDYLFIKSITAINNDIAKLFNQIEKGE